MTSTQCTTKTLNQEKSAACQLENGITSQLATVKKTIVWRQKRFLRKENLTSSEAIMIVIIQIQS
jgi:hypothetical protein